MRGKGAALADRTWALCAGVSGICGIVGYALLVAIDASPAWSVLLLTTFGFGFALASIGLHLGVTGVASPRVSLIAAVANTAAAVELVAMALVQIAVKAVDPHPARSLVAVWLGLDVAWDVFGAAGTILFGIAIWRHARVGRIIGLAGALAGLVLLVLNIATFPTPPAEAGWFDAGPFVALWYLVLLVRILWLAAAKDAPPPAAGRDVRAPEDVPAVAGVAG